MPEQVFCIFCKRPLQSNSVFGVQAHESCQKEIDNAPNSIDSFLLSNPLMIDCSISDISDSVLEHDDIDNGIITAINYYNDEDGEDEIDVNLFYDRDGSIKSALITAPDPIVRDLLTYFSRTASLTGLSLVCYTGLPPDLFTLKTITSLTLYLNYETREIDFANFTFFHLDYLEINCLPKNLNKFTNVSCIRTVNQLRLSNALISKEFNILETKKLYLNYDHLPNYNLDLDSLPFQLEELYLHLSSNNTFYNTSYTVKILLIDCEFVKEYNFNPLQFIQSILKSFPKINNLNLTIRGSSRSNEFNLLEDHIKELITNHSFTTISNTYNIVIKSYNGRIQLLFTSKNP